jgi:hypothetical protein
MLRGHLSTMPSPPPRSPLSRSAGEGPGVRVARSAGEGPGVRVARSAGEGLGVRAALTFPPTPAAPPRGEAGGDEQSSSDPAPASHHITPLPQRGRGAGGEGDPSPGSPFIHGAKVCWTPSRNDCTDTGHAQ